MKSFFADAVKSRATVMTGVRTPDAVPAELFPIRRTGVSTEPMLAAARAFLDALGPEQRAGCQFGIESDAWRSWCNFHAFLFRHGACLAELDETPRGLALALMQASLGEAGYATARNVMRLNQHLAELTGRAEEFGEWYYWISIMGEPSETEPWGWQIDGHHLIVNCFVLGDQIVLTPTFMGSEPVSAETGAFAGTRVFAEEEAAGLALMRLLGPAQRRAATLGTVLPFDVFAHAFNDNVQLPFEGLAWGAMEAGQQAALRRLIAIYLRRDRPGHAALRLAEIEAHLADTWFAWIGPCDDESPFYYRVHSPVVLIEFDHQPGIMFANDVPTRRHAHTLVRTPNGNDYGKALLRAHYERLNHARGGASETDGDTLATRSSRRLGEPMDDLRRGL
jgi:hypothetical protein